MAVSRNEESCSGDKAQPVPGLSHRDCRRKTVSMSPRRQMCSKHCTVARRGPHLLIVSPVGLSSATYIHVRTCARLYGYNDLPPGPYYAVVPKVH